MKHVDRAIVALAVLSALFTAAFVVYTFLYGQQSPVASEIQFEALRVARRFPLYVDPWAGAWELGAPPSRYYVLYTPVFPTLIGALSKPTLASTELVGRSVAVLGWLACYVPIVVFAPKDRRRVTALATMLAAGIYFIARHAASMSPDTLATALVCGGVLRSVVKDEIDPLAAVLLIAGPFVKPSCLGGAAGAAIVLFAQRRPGWHRALLAGLAAFVGLIAVCHVTSDGAWLTHIKSSTGQPLTLTRWVQEMGSRAMVLGVPHAAVAWLAYKRKTTWLVLGPLVGSLVWATFMMAKHGSGSHYWFEPTGLALIAISRLPRREPSAPSVWLPLGALAFAILNAAASWPPFLTEPARARAHAEKFAALARELPRGPGEFLLSSDFDIECQLNDGHISVPAWQSAFLARTGKFPKEEWQKDLTRPEVKWIVLSLDPRAPRGDTNDEQVEQSPFYDILAAPLREHFEPYREVGGMHVFARKTGR